MGVKVYGIVGSPFLRSVQLGLEEKGAPYELVKMGFGEPKEPPYLAKHPFGRVPFFEHDGFSLYETQAILRYVDAVFPGPALKPTDPKKLARMDQLIGISDWYMFRQVTAIIGFNRLIAPMVGRPTDLSAIAAAVPDAKNCAKVLEGFVKEGGDYMVGSEPTIADLMLAPQMVFFAMTPEGREILPGHPALGAWLERMNARPSMVKTELKFS
ncbi:MAG TPA: glutathione S-transferase family protein [Alphaproteobacteria bacterium]|nr:glutathione S-transferase family protein [Alphaproteobacteria bacterium]